jgi:hypothetical protein
VEAEGEAGVAACQERPRGAANGMRPALAALHELWVWSSFMDASRSSQHRSSASSTHDGDQPLVSVVELLPNAEPTARSRSKAPARGPDDGAVSGNETGRPGDVASRDHGRMVSFEKSSLAATSTRCGCRTRSRLARRWRSGTNGGRQVSAKLRPQTQSGRLPPQVIRAQASRLVLGWTNAVGSTRRWESRST